MWILDRGRGQKQFFWWMTNGWLPEMTAARHIKASDTDRAGPINI
jgi:hypothetical protein